jgi:hypothetical protein
MPVRYVEWERTHLKNVFFVTEYAFSFLLYFILLCVGAVVDIVTRLQVG